LASLTGVFIVAAKRTPFGTYGGLLKGLSATDLTEHAARAALAAGKVPPEIIDSVIVGNVMQSSPDAIYIARHVGLRVGVPVPVPALTVNRLCGSGFQSIANGCQVLSSFFACMLSFKTNKKMTDFLLKFVLDSHYCLIMSCFAEGELALPFIFLLVVSAQDAGHFNAEMAPIEVKTKKGKESMQKDEHPKPQTTLEQLAKLPPVFKKDGTVTAGNASGVCDGAGAVVIASESALKKHSLTPLARIVAYHSSGCDPSIMGIGPVPAITEVLKKAGLTLKDMDLVEVNEAFAPQYLAVEKVLGLDPEQNNVNGGAIAVGHPLGASGSRITAHLVHELRRRGGKYAVGSACIGGGQGIALLIENTA
uniref:Acetyl-CoA acyltransferase 2 n=1 Tax=Pavo cristatus TaxID=9049 RepID=A0A8C9FIW4_PAVCR